MPAPVRVTAVVVTWNARELLRPCLEALTAQVVPVGWTYDVVLVDNASDDDTVAWCNETFPAVRVLRSARNRGFAGGANLALRDRLAARSADLETGDKQIDIVVLVNNDAVVRDGFVTALASPLTAHERVAATTATIVLAERFRPDADGPYRRADGARFSPAADGTTLVNSTGNQVRTDGNGEDRDWLKPLTELAAEPADPDVFGFSGGACALRLDVLAGVGVFADEYFMYYEDTDLSWRLRLSGWDIRYVADAVVDHLHARSSVAGSDLFTFHNQRNRLLTLVRNADPVLALTGFARFAAAVVLGRLDRRLGVRIAVGTARLLPWALRTRTRSTGPRRRAVRQRLARP